MKISQFIYLYDTRAVKQENMFGSFRVVMAPVGKTHICSTVGSEPRPQALCGVERTRLKKHKYAKTIPVGLPMCEKCVALWKKDINGAWAKWAKAAQE